MNTVSFYFAKDYDPLLLKEIVEKIIADHGGYQRLFAKGKKVVIKPNLVMKKKPEGGATTHPALLEAVLLCLLPHTRDITVAECSGGLNTEALMKGVYRETGIEEVCQKHGIPIHYQMNAAEVFPPEPISCRKLEVLDIFTTADVFINLAKMKTHSLTTVTGAAKNLYGVIPGLRKVEHHANNPKVDDFAKLICDINKALPPTLSIVDGILGMEKDGPTGGAPKWAYGLLGGVNPYAIDEAMCRFMGIDSKLSPIQECAKKHGLFDGEYNLTGDSMEDHLPTPFILPDSQKPNLLRDFLGMYNGKLSRFLAPKPKIKKSLCIGCGECARLCPKKTITVKNGKAKIHHKNCIRCWCCQEMCPKKAVLTHSNPIMKLT
ncbi:MAG: DUF362 domain-containing protein [Ruminococcaceae bacterium]|nr:DUF362 domain-containing protein [Oscillospiraceae bacterium]